jgi:hypothetical protein
MWIKKNQKVFIYILALICISSAVTPIEYKFSLGEICYALLHEAMLCDGEQVELLEVVNATENKKFPWYP